MLHTGSTLTAEAGVSLRVLMERMGHRSIRAASGPRSLTLPAVRKRPGRVNDSQVGLRSGSVCLCAGEPVYRDVRE